MFLTGLPNRFREFVYMRRYRRTCRLGTGVRICDHYARRPTALRNYGPPEALTLGDGVRVLFCDITVDPMGRLEIGDRTYVGNRTFIQSAQAVTIGADCLISHHVYIVDSNNHPISPQMRLEITRGLRKVDHYDSEMAPIVIEDAVWIGHHAMVMKGVTIGKGSVIGAGSVVTSSVPPYSVAVGNPARVVKTIEEGRLEGD